MEIRRLVRSGNSSFTLAVPKTWVDKNNLKKGTLLYVKENPDNTLNVSKEFQKKDEGQEVQISAGNKDIDLVISEIRVAYFKNLNRLVVRFSKDRKDLNEVMNLAKEEISSMAALEIVEEDSATIIAKSFLDYTEIYVREVIRRIDNMTRSMLLDAMACFDDPSIAKTIKQRDIGVNRLVFLNFKILRRCTQDVEVAMANKIKLEALPKYWQITFLIEEIADIAKRVACKIERAVVEKKKFDKKTLKNLYKDAIDLYIKAMTYYYKEDFTNAILLTSKIKAMQGKCSKFMASYPDSVLYLIGGRLNQLLSKTKDLIKVILYFE